MSGGVRNLRAMFENKEESSISPPNRGRSPAGSTGGGSNGTSPRPLSKVRTSFVAVERNGQAGIQWGLRKESSSINSNTDPSLATRRPSFIIDEESAPQAIAEKNEVIRSEYSERKNSVAVKETVPESAIESPPVESEKKSGYMNGKPARRKSGSAESKPSANPDKKTSVEDRNAKLLPGDPTSSAAVSGGAALNNVGGFGEELHGNTDDEMKSQKTLRSKGKSLPVVRSSKPAAISTSQPNASSKPGAKPTKSPSTAKSPTKSTTTGQASTAPAKSDKAPAAKSSSVLQPPVPTKALEKKTSRTSLTSPTSSKTVSRPAPSTAAASTSEKKPSPSKAAATSEKKASVASPPSAFHKPRPKSPTKPVKLPSSLTAPTSSSLSKVAAAAAPSSRQSLGTSNKVVARSPSRTSLGPKQELRHKSSKLENARPALGPPPSASVRKQPSRQSLPKQAAPADESFLARMMRPTTASASKTHEKVVTPPRPKPTASRPTTRDGAGHHHKPHEGLKSSPSTNTLPAMPSSVAVEEVEKSEATQAATVAAIAAEVDKSGPIMDEKCASKNASPEDPKISITSSHQEELSKAPEASPDIPVETEVQVAAVAADVNDEKPIEEESKTDSEVPEPKAEPEADKLIAPEHTSVPDEKSVDPSESEEKPVVQDGPEVEVPVTEENASGNEAEEPNGIQHTDEEDPMGVD